MNFSGSLDLVKNLRYILPGPIASAVTVMRVRKNRRFESKVFDHMGALDVGDGSASTACEILDISDGGARLRPLMCAPRMLPDKFTHLLSACGRVRRKCRVAWRARTELGVQFYRA